MSTQSSINEVQPYSLEGKVAIVTGASKGIGKAIAVDLADAGAKVVLAARSLNVVEQAAVDIRETGAEAIAVPTDVTDVTAVKNLIHTTVDTYQNIDILINNAGNGIFGTVDEFDPADWDSVVNSNMKGVFLCVKYALPHLLANGGGQIINVLSVAAKVAFPASSAYCAAKAGALALTKVIATEVRNKNIRVTAILPGSVETPFWDDIPQHPDFEKMLKPEHVSNVVLSICQQPLGMVTEEVVVMPPLGIL
ncbi:MAG: SDR family NAD(P)-dependent oxidoreductase [Candidatus Poribacteria bacterium]|nr:SDR family NAD(P)-dependent oxidoreductase [Candidatus Poribacteria bacterium]